MNKQVFTHKPRGKRDLHRVMAVVLCLAGLVAIPQAFIYSSVIMDAAHRLLGWEVVPGFSGGVELARFLDAPGDDRGAGNLEYPRSGLFAKPGILDLVRYTVHQPQTNARWSEPRDYWQLDIDLAAVSDPGDPGLPAGPCIRIYIDLDGALSGSTEGIDARGELAAFDPAHPWDLCVALDANLASAKLVNAGGQILARFPAGMNREKGRITLRVPLEGAQVDRVLDGRPSWHYVVVGAWESNTPGHFMAIKEKAGVSAGGGSASALTPRIFDCLLPKGESQEAVLAGFDEAVGLVAVLKPVMVPAWNPWARADGVAELSGVDARIDQQRDRLMEDLARQAAAHMDEEGKASITRARQVDMEALLKDEAPGATSQPEGGALPAGAERLIVAGIALFHGEDDAGSLRLLTKAAGVLPREPRILAYLGALKAREGGRAGNPGDAVRLVNEGYQLMDQAVTLAPPDTPVAEEVLLVRGSVSGSVPEAVFQKGSQGAADFAAVARMRSGDPENAARAWIRAGLCLEQAGDADGALRYFQQAEALGPEDPGTRLELLKHGLGAEP